MVDCLIGSFFLWFLNALFIDVDDFLSKSLFFYFLHFLKKLSMLSINEVCSSRISFTSPLRSLVPQGNFTSAYNCLIFLPPLIKIRLTSKKL